jgi:DNA-binding beta-propeller fold protein YncE
MKSLCLAAAATLAVAVLSAPAPAAELELVQTLDSKGKMGGLDHVAIDLKGERLFLANKANNTLDVFDLKTGKLVMQKTGQAGIQGVAFDAEQNLIFVGLGSNGLCNVIDGKTFAVRESIKFKDDADNVRLNPKTKRVYVAHAENALGVIDAKTFALKADIKLSAGAEGFVMEDKRPRLYLVTPKPCQLLVIDTEKNVVTDTYPIKMAEGAHTIVLDEEKHRLYIGCRNKPMVIVVDSETGKELGSVDIPSGNDDMHIDLKRQRLYASCGEGFVAVIKFGDGDKLEVVEKLATIKDAKTSLYVPETGRLYLAVPRQASKEGPEIRVYKVKE